MFFLFLHKNECCGYSLEAPHLKHLSTKTYLVGTHYKHLSKVLLMSTHSICFLGEIRKKYQQFSDEKSALAEAI